MTLPAANESLVRNRRKLLAFLDDPICQIGMKFVCEGEKSVLVGWRIITKTADQAHQQRPILNCNNVSSAGEVGRWTGDEYEGLAGIGFGSAEVCSAVRSIESDGRFFGRCKSNRRKPLPCPVSPARRVDHQVALDRSRVTAADSTNDAITAYQFSNRATVLKSNIGTSRCPLANDVFEETATGTIAFKARIKWRSYRTSRIIGLAVGQIPNSIAPHGNSCRTKLSEILGE